MSNKDFLERINFILGGRKKHPWGQALGIRGTRITQMFLGQVPTADALEIIHRAEGVSIDWLLTGDAVPFCVRHLTDQDGVTLLRKQNGDEQYHLLTTSELTRIPALVLTRSERRPIARNAVTQYIATILVAEVGHAMMQEMAMDRLHLTAIGEPELERLQAGKLGPYELRQTFLPHSRRAEAADLHRITELLGRQGPAELSHQESALLCAYRRQPEHKQAAYRVLLDVEL
ncbi:hypothetical protein [Candidatus Thiosymbion oneisti]|uniref:hypothetical protein n=1 Tax=Candidatus Thiosymbion oneisti TaxID=589554 RepID=UPI00105C7C6F|nr:hypothetical protein [Candidatus Thiosymbion oneisti]